MVGMRLLRHHRVDMHRHRRATNRLLPVISPHRKAISSLRVGMRLRLHEVIRHLQAGILCRRVVWPILLWT
jgi:hypothetical protein